MPLRMGACGSIVRQIAGRALVASLALVAALCVSGSPPSRATSEHPALPTIVVARFVLVDTAPADEQYDVAADKHRIELVSERVRALVARSGVYRLLDRGPKDTAPPYSYFSCPACIWDWAHARGADYVLVGWVHKQSRLILSVGMLLLDARSRTAVKETSTQIRDDTDRMWLAGTEYLLKRDIFAADTQGAAD